LVDLLCKCKQSVPLENRKDTVEHVLDAVDWTLRLVEFLELFAEVEESIEVIGQRDVLGRRLRQQTHSEVQLPVRTEHEWTSTVIRVHGFRTQEPLELSTNHDNIGCMLNLLQSTVTSHSLYISAFSMHK